MENNYDDIVLLEKYFDNSLSKEDQTQVENRLTIDAEFKELYMHEKLMMKGIQFGHLKDKLEFLKDLESHLPALTPTKQEPKVISIKAYWKPLAAAASILIATLIYVFAPQRAPLNERLYQSYYETFDSPGSGLTRGGNSGVVTLKKRAYEAYDNSNYAEAARLFEASLKEKDDAITHLCLGNAYMKTGQWNKAEESFLNILKDHSDLVTQAKWYLALTYLKQNKMEKTKSTLWEITTSSTYGEKAKKLLSELD